MPRLNPGGMMETIIALAALELGIGDRLLRVWIAAAK